MHRQIILIISLLLSACGQAVLDDGNVGGKPRLLGVADLALAIGAEFDPLAGVSALDDEDGDVSATLFVTGQVDLQREGDYPLVYSAHDSSGNSVEAVRLVSVRKAERVPPQLFGVEDVILVQGADFRYRAGVSAVDNIDGELTDRVEVSGSLNLNQPGEYEVYYRVADSQGNVASATRVVRVLSAGTIAPQFSGIDDLVLSLGASFDPLSGVSAVDDIDGDVAANILVVGAVNTDQPGRYFLSYLVSDRAGNQRSQLRVVQIISPDTQPPLISGVDAIEILQGSNFDPWAGVAVQDNVDGDLLAKTQLTGSVNSAVPAVYLLDYVVSDAAGNETQQQRRVTVLARDTVAPEIFGIDARTLLLGSLFDALLGVTAIDVVDGDLTNQLQVSGTVDVQTAGQYQLTYRVADKAGNEHIATRNIVVEQNDKTPPQISGVADVSVGLRITFWPLQGVHAMDDVDGDVTDRLLVIGMVNTQQAGSYQLEYQAADYSGNIAFATRTVTVVAGDLTPPVFSAMSNDHIVLGAPFDPLAGVSANDDVDGELTALIVVSGTVNTAQVGSYRLDYSVSDTAGNLATTTRLITIDAPDITAPQFSGVVNITLAQGQAFDPLAGVQALDDVDGDVTAAIAVTGSVNVAQLGSYTLNYTVADRAGNQAFASRVVQVVANDTVPPQISGVQDKTLVVGQSFDPRAGVMAIDDVDGDLTAALQISGSVNNLLAGVYQLQYSVSDAAGNQANVLRTITVQLADLIAPQFSGVVSASIILGQPFDALAGVSTIDDRDGDVSASIVVSGSVNTQLAGNYPLQYSVSDRAGNIALAARVITVFVPDTTPPLLSGVADTIVLQNSVFDPRAGVSAQDAVDGDLTATIEIIGSVDSSQTGSYLLTYRVSDAAGNLAQATRRVMVEVAAPVPAASDVHRLLTQATFGPTEELIAQVQQLGIEPWLDAQLNMGSAYDSDTDAWKTHLQRTIEISQEAHPGFNWYKAGAFNRYIASDNVGKYQLSAWWENVLGSTKAGYQQVASDQVRQRVAYALSQILVVSGFPSPLDQRGEAIAYYYDLLAKNALGNYRDLLGDVARSPTMGIYLSHQGNEKADYRKGLRPDENFARELMQLFTIGLYSLNRDGTPDRDGNPATFPDAGDALVQTYQQTDVEELAKVMTGWDLVNNSVFFGYDYVKEGDYTQQMEFTPGKHEDEVLEGGDGLVTVLASTFALNSGADGSGMDAALDVLFNHQNTAPFVSRRLIQRLVTSNPSPAYIERVAAVFENNGLGVRGDLKAVVRAILLDEEARNSAITSQPGYGKVKEPIIALSQMLRATHVSPLNGWKGPGGAQMVDVYWYPSAETQLAQAPLRSQSVFNFYQSDYVPTNAQFQQNGWTLPEVQIQSGVVLVEYGNLIHRMLSDYEFNKITKLDGVTVADFALKSNSYKTNGLFLTNFSTELALFEQALEGDSNGDFAKMKDASVDANGNTPKAKAVDALLDHVDMVLLGGSMTSEVRAALKHYLVDATGTNTGSHFEMALNIIRDTYHLVGISSSYMIQK